MTGGRRPRVLVLARNYPNNVLPTLGLWTRRLVNASTRAVDPTVIAPVPYAPPLLSFEAFAKFRRVVSRDRDPALEGEYAIFHPRIPLPPGHALHRFEAGLGWPFIRRIADGLHRERQFDLIHSHFIFPDGVLAARLGARWGVPVVTTEHAMWSPWLDEEPAVKRQVLRALPAIRFVLPVSEALRRNIEEAAGPAARCRVVPNVLDDALFTPPAVNHRRDPDQLLFVGLTRQVKGLDLLVRALGLLAAKRPALRLLVIGGAFYRGYQRDADAVRRLVEELGLAPRITFAGEQDPAAVAEAMRRSALLVVPSRRETFSLVSVEAIASGMPVLATRCGGPEEIITPANGLLVPVEDAAALASGIEELLGRRDGFDPSAMHRDMAARFGTEAIGRRLAEVYTEALQPA